MAQESPKTAQESESRKTEKESSNRAFNMPPRGTHTKHVPLGFRRISACSPVRASKRPRRAKEHPREPQDGLTKMAPGRFLRPHDGPKSPQELSKTAQEAPHKAPRRPQTATRQPSSSQDGSKGLRKGPKTAQQGSESVQEGPKMAVNWFKTAAEAPKKGEDIQERRLFKHGTGLERVVNSTSFPLCCCAGTVAGIAAGS